MQAFAKRAESMVLETAGVNALDFHLAFHLGRLAVEDPGGLFLIISKGIGFGPLIQHLKARKVLSARSASIEEMPCFSAASHAPAEGQPALSPPPALSKEAPSFDELWKRALAHLVSTRATKPAKARMLHGPSVLQHAIRKTDSG